MRIFIILCYFCSSSLFAFDYLKQRGHCNEKGNENINEGFLKLKEKVQQTIEERHELVVIEDSCRVFALKKIF